LSANLQRSGLTWYRFRYKNGIFNTNGTERESEDTSISRPTIGFYLIDEREMDRIFLSDLVSTRSDDVFRLVIQRILKHYRYDAARVPRSSSPRIAKPLSASQVCRRAASAVTLSDVGEP